MEISERETIYKFVLKNKLHEVLPMPREFYKMMEVEPPKPMELKECFPKMLNAIANTGQAVEIREPAPGGVRPVEFKEYKLELLEESEAAEDLKQSKEAETKD